MLKIDILSEMGEDMNQICYVEYDTNHPGDFVVDVPETHDWWLIIFTHTPAEFYIDGKMVEYPSKCMVIFPPNFRILYRGCSDSYSDDWIRFYSNESYVVHSMLPPGIPVRIPNPDYCHRLFQLLAEENFFQNKFREQSIDNLLRLLISKFIEAYDYDTIHSEYHQLHNLRLEIKNNPGFPWTVSHMAERLHLSSGYLQALYRKTFQVSCMEDVIHNRILLAKEHLLQSTYTISKIAEICGYRNVEHFCRQFRKYVGMSPKTYRMNYATLCKQLG